MPVKVYDWIAYHARRTPAKRALVDLATGRHFTYGEMHDRVARLAGGLAGEGVSPGDRVAVLAYNATDIFEIQFACWRLAAIFLPLNWRLAPPELDAILADAAPGLMIVGEEFAGQAARAANRPDHLIDLRPGAADYGYERLIAGGEPVPIGIDRDHGDTATLLYTSGTTGQPKGVRVTHGMNFWNMVNLGTPSLVTRDTVHLTILPLFHTAGINAYGNVVFHHGGTNVVLKSFEPAAVLGHMQDRALGLTHVYGVPANYQFIAQLPDFAKADLSGMVTAGTGGAPLARSLLETWADKGLALQQGYGMTETSPTVMLLDAERAIDKLGSAGLPALHTEVRLVAPDGHDIDKADEVGEIWVKGPNVTPGYWNEPEETEAALIDGWLRTGDAAMLDADGYFFIVDRWKDMYISGGENVYPAEVENVLYRFEGVAEAAVIGAPDQRWGEVGIAYIVPAEGATIDEAALIAFCRDNLAGYKVPKAVRLVETLPRNATGKILKRELRAGQGDEP